MKSLIIFIFLQWVSCQRFLTYNTYSLTGCTGQPSKSITIDTSKCFTNLDLCLLGATTDKEKQFCQQLPLGSMKLDCQGSAYSTRNFDDSSCTKKSVLISGGTLNNCTAMGPNSKEKSSNFICKDADSPTSGLNSLASSEWMLWIGVLSLLVLL